MQPGLRSPIATHNLVGEGSLHQPDGHGQPPTGSWHGREARLGLQQLADEAGALLASIGGYWFLPKMAPPPHVARANGMKGGRPPWTVLELGARRKSGSAGAGHGGLCAVTHPAQQLRQLGDVGGDAPGLIAGGQVRRRATV